MGQLYIDTSEVQNAEHEQLLKVWDMAQQHRSTREVQEAEQLLEVWNTAQLHRNTREAQEQVQK